MLKYYSVSRRRISLHCARTICVKKTWKLVLQKRNVYPVMGAIPLPSSLHSAIVHKYGNYEKCVMTKLDISFGRVRATRLILV